MRDALRLSVGTLTALRVRPPARVDRGTARAAMLLAPVVGLGLGLVTAAVLALLRTVLGPPVGEIGPHGGDPHLQAIDLVSAAIAVAMLALATRALHLDGLADTADGLGSGRRGADGLQVMRRSDIGPMGVVTVVLVLLVQVTALSAAAGAHHGTTAVLVGVTTGRVALLWGCRRGVPAARTDGLGALVAGTIPIVAAVGWTLVIALAAAGLARLDDDTTPRLVLLSPIAVVAGIVVAVLLVRRTVHRFGGITGDVLGATVELASAVALVVLAAG